MNIVVCTRFCVVTLMLSVVPPAQADQIATLPGGKRALLKDDGTYRIVDEKKEPQGNFSEIKMSDLKVDIKELAGKSVRVAGRGFYFGENLMLGDPDLPYDSSPVFVKIDKLSRENRKWIISNCAQPCGVTIEGEIKRDIGFFAPGIAAVNAIYK
jgi:hypothetical protein